MSKDKQVTADQVKKALVAETTYKREEIEAAPSSFGVLPEVLAGALRLVDGEELSRSQVLAAIEKFKKRKV
ncbi:oligoribonuclease [Sporosarcina sp. FSL K6-1508]|uniref:oligoribonuclease n=1 Tax=Sporosarcina sp. FSL K6-1508 TaxID=2921553 RepID=UPI0030F654F5